MTTEISRRAVLVTGGVVAVGAAAGAVPLVAAAAGGPEQLTAERLLPLLRRAVDVSWSSGRGRATLLALRGPGTQPARSRSFELSLAAPAALGRSGETVVVSHASLGRHDLFAVPDRDPAVWVIVVQDAPPGAEVGSDV